MVQRWLEKVRTRTGDSTCGATVCCERWKDVLIQRLDNRYLREWFGPEYLFWRIREEICRSAIPEMTTFLDEYFFRLKKKQTRIDERLYLQMTRALARMEQTVDLTEPD